MRRRGRGKNFKRRYQKPKKKSHRRKSLRKYGTSRGGIRL